MTGSLVLPQLPRPSQRSSVGIDTSHHVWAQNELGAVWIPSLQSSSLTTQNFPLDDGGPATQSLTVPPAIFVPGVTIRCICQGVYSGALGGVGLLFALGFVSLANTAQIQWGDTAVSGSGALIPFSAQCICTVRTVGTSGTIGVGAMALNSQGTTGIINQVAEADRDNSLGNTFDSTATTSLQFTASGGLGRGFAITSIIIEVLSP